MFFHANYTKLWSTLSTPWFFCQFLDGLLGCSSGKTMIRHVLILKMGGCKEYKQYNTRICIILYLHSWSRHWTTQWWRNMKAMEVLIYLTNRGYFIEENKGMQPRIMLIFDQQIISKYHRDSNVSAKDDVENCWIKMNQRKTRQFEQDRLREFDLSLHSVSSLHFQKMGRIRMNSTLD